MRYAKKSTKSAYKSRSRRRKYTTKRKPTVSTVKKIVKRAIAANTENKQVDVYRPLVTVYPSNHANFAISQYPLTPYSGFATIPQGTSQGNRIGNRIKIKSLTFKYILSPLPYTLSTNGAPRPSEVILWIFYDKQNPSDIPAIGNDFLQLGGSSQGLTNSLMDCTAPVNTDRYRLLYRRVHKVGHATYAGTGNRPDSQSFANNDFKLNVRGSVNLTKYIVKNVKFNDGNNDPITRGLFFCFQAVSAAPPSYSTADIPCNVSYTSSIIYEDA